MSDPRIESAAGGCARCARSSHTFLAALGDEGIDVLERSRTHRRFARGSILFRQGEEADEVFCIAGAVVKLVRGSTGGRAAVVGVLGCGRVAGLSAAMGPGIHAYTGEVVTDGVMGCIPRATLVELSDAYPGFSRALTAQVAAEAHRGVRQVELFAEPRLAPRLATVLLDLAGDRPASCGPVARGLSRRDLAGMCGVGHEAVVRCLSRWRGEGVVDDDGGAIRLVDVPRLQRIAEGAP